MRTQQACANGHRGYMGIAMERGHALLRIEESAMQGNGGVVVVVVETIRKLFRLPHGSS
jgi:hypothetical protein